MVQRTVRRKPGKRHPRKDEIYPRIRKWSADGAETEAASATAARDGEEMSMAAGQHGPGRDRDKS